MQSQHTTDQELIRLYTKGDNAAITELIERHEARVFTYVKMMVKDQTIAEDVFQDTFVKVIHTLKSGNYNEEGKFLPWVIRIAHNLVIDHFRKQKRFPLVHSGEDQDIFRHIGGIDTNAEDRLVKEQIHVDVKKLLAYLPAEQQEVVLLRHFADMSFQEIAQMTGVSINTALGRMRYALINLRKLIQKNQIELES